MLTNVRYNEDDYEFPCLLVLGSFDAIHTGHVELLKKAKLQAKINGLDLGVMVFTNGKGGDQICTFEEKLALLEQYNVKFVLSVEFTDEFKKTAPLDFLGNVEEKLNVKAYMSGKDFRFGAGAKGKSSTLKNYGEDEDNGVWYMPIKDVTSADGEKISTSKIKELLESGDITAANTLLGRNYSVSADVLSCDETSLTLAYPAGKVQIKHGAYAVKCLVSDAEHEGCATYGESLKVQIKNLSSVPEGEKITVEFTAALCGGEEVAEETAQEVNEQPAQEVAEETPAEIKETVEELAVTEDVTPDEPHEETQTEDQPAEEITEETVEEQPAEDVTEPAAEPAPEEEGETQVERVEEPVVEVFAEDSGFDDDYYEEDFIEDQPVEEELQPVAEPASEEDGGTQVETAEETPTETTETEITEEPTNEDNVD